MVDSQKTGSREFGELLRRARERRGMSRNDLVEATGLSYPYISQLETAYRKPSPGAIRKLADALEISLDEIFAALEQPSPEPQSVRKSVDDTGWIRNEAYARSSVEMPSPPRLEVAATHPAPGVMPAPAPRSPAQSAAAGSAAPDSAGGGRSTASTPSVIEEIVLLFNEIPPAKRLDALARVQARVVESVIDEGIRRGHSPH